MWLLQNPVGIPISANIFFSFLCHGLCDLSSLTIGSLITEESTELPQDCDRAWGGGGVQGIQVDGGNKHTRC